MRDNGLCSFIRQHKLQNYTNITKEIAQAGMNLFRQNYHWRQPVRSLGINISDLAGDSVSTQTDLFSDETQRERKEHLDRATDWLKRRFGTHAVQPAVLLKDQKLSGFDPIHDNTIHPVGYF